MAQLLPLPAVEGHPGRVAAVRADGDLEVDAGRHHDGPAQLRQHYASVRFVLLKAIAI